MTKRKQKVKTVKSETIAEFAGHWIDHYKAKDWEKTPKIRKKGAINNDL